MIFSEVYSLYYQAVQKLLRAILERRRRDPKHKITEKEAREIIGEASFAESFISILSAIRKEEWQVMNKDFDTPLRHPSDLPLTLLEKRWLKTMMADERMKLFTEDIQGLTEVEPLYCPEDIHHMDKAADADDFSDLRYIEHFRLLMRAIEERQLLRIAFLTAQGYAKEGIYLPQKLEYSIRDVKFRLIAQKSGSDGIVSAVQVRINLSRIRSCTLAKIPVSIQMPIRQEIKKKVILLLMDRRNALERAMIHFAHFEKSTEKIDEEHYEIVLYYYAMDESEVLIRILSFGPMIQVLAPNDFREQIRERLRRQVKLWKDVG